jgi:CTP:molybdopterin cytidylyltransferase MocA
VIAGLVLAAGPGSRFGEQAKLLADLAGRPLLEHAVRAQCAVPELERVVVVLGARARELLETVDFDRAETVVCDRWREGQGASLRRGAHALAGADKVLVTLVARFVDEPPGTRAVYGGRPGHPVVLGRTHLRDIAELRGDHGARHLLQGGRTIECGHLGSGRDVDTPEDLEAIRHEARAVL